MDYLRLMNIVKESRFKGYVGTEYEGTTLSEPDWIGVAKALPEKIFAGIWLRTGYSMAFSIPWVVV